MREWKGLHKDNRASRQPPGYWREAKNILIEDYVPTNELGPEVSGNLDGDTVGYVTINDIVFVFTLSSIGIKVFKLEGNNRTSLTSFATNRNIEYLVGQAQYDYKGDITILFGGPNTPLYFIDTGNLPNSGEENDFLYSLLIKNDEPFYYPVSGGALPQGTYYISIRYVKDNNKTAFSNLSAPIVVGSKRTYRLEPDLLTNTAIRCTVDLGEFDTYDLAILKTSTIGATTSHLLTDLVGNTDIRTIPDTPIALEELTPNFSIKSPTSITTHNNRYYIGGYSTDDPRPDLQKFTTDHVKLEVDISAFTPTYPYSRTALNEKTLLGGEVYAFYIAYRYPEGHLTPFYHIPGLDSSNYTSPTASATDSISHAGGSKKRFQVEDTSYGDKFGYWENVEDYPDTTYNNQRIYPVGKVRFHKTPDQPIYYDTNGKLRTQHIYPKVLIKNRDPISNLPKGFVDIVLACAKHDEGLRITDDLLFGGLQNLGRDTDKSRDDELWNYRTPVGNLILESNANGTNNYPNYSYPVPNTLIDALNNESDNYENVFFTTINEIDQPCYFVPKNFIKSVNTQVRVDDGQRAITIRDLTNENNVITAGNSNSTTKTLRTSPFNNQTSKWINLVSPRKIEADTITGSISNYMNSQCTILRPKTQTDSEIAYGYLYGHSHVKAKTILSTFFIELPFLLDENLTKRAQHRTKSNKIHGESIDVYGTFYKDVQSVYTKFWSQELTILNKLNADTFEGDAYSGFKAIHLSHPDHWLLDQESSEQNKFGRVLYYYYIQSEKNIKLIKEERGNALSNEAGNEFTVDRLTLKPGVSSFPGDFDSVYWESANNGPILSRVDPSNDLDTIPNNDPYSFTSFNPFNTFVSKLPSTIIRSTVFTNKFVNKPRFLSNDTYTLSGEFGPIQNLASHQGKLLIHTLNNIYITASKEEIQTDSLSVSIGSGDIFRIEPSSFFQTNYAGIPSPYSALSTRVGYTWIDPNNGIFIFNNQIDNLSNKGLFHTHRDEFPNSTNFSIAHDEYNDRLIYMYVHNNLPKACSYHTTLQSWISEHDYSAPFAASTSSNVYLLDNNIRILNRVRQQFYIDIVFNAPEKVVFSSFTVETECESNGKELIESFDFLICYNNTQCSGQQDFTAARDEGVYRYNQLWDLTAANEKLNRIVLDGKDMHALYRGISNRQKRRFRGEYMVVRLIGLNKDRKLYLHRIEPYIVPSP